MKLRNAFIGGVASVLLAGASATASADLFLPFSIEEGAIPGTPDNLIEDAGKFTGTYTEILTVNPDFTIDFAGAVQWAGIADVNNNLIDSFLGAPQIAGGYRLYSLFSGSGVYDPITDTFSIDSAVFNFVADPDGNTTFTFPATGAGTITLAGDGDDIELGSSADLLFGSGVAGVPGAFQAVWIELGLTPEGESYFTAPRPFYTIVEATGDFDQDTFGPGTFQVTGDVSAIFQRVPEPGTLALMGLALALLGAVTLRRRREEF